MNKLIYSIVGVFASLFLFSFAYAAAPLFTVPQGGTASSTLTGILIGNGASAVKTLTIGTNLSLTGTTLNASGGGGTFPFTASANYNSTSTALGFLQGAFFTASTTFSGFADKLLSVDLTGKVFGSATSTLSASSPLTGSFVQLGSGGSLGIQAASNSQNGYLALADFALIHAATTTFTSPLTYTNSTNAVTCPTCNTSSASLTSVASSNGIQGGTITTSGTLSLISYLATSSAETDGNLAYWTTTGATPAKLGSVATGTVSAGSSAITVTAGRSAIGGALAIDCATSASGQNGCLSSTDWSTFNQKIGWGQATTTPWSPDQFLYLNHTGLEVSAASSSFFGYTPLNPTRALTVAGTANQITSSAGSQDLSADRTWTLSLPTHVIFPAGGFETVLATTTNATTTGSQYFTGITASRPLYVDSTGKLTSAGSGTSGNCVNWGANNTFGDAGSACGSAGGGAFPFTPTTWGGVVANSTSTLLLFNAGAVISTSSIGNLVSGTLTATSSFTLPFITDKAHASDVNGLTYGVATGTVSAGSSAITVTAGRQVFGGALSIDCATAGASQNGCLSSANWATFNNKIDWGAATSTAANQVVFTDNNGKLTSTATSSETCTAPLSCTSHDVLKGGGAITITQSGTAANGYLSSTDWNTFNNKISWGTATSTSPNQNVYTDNFGKLVSAATSSETCTSPLSCTSHDVLKGGGAITIANAVSDGSTKGAASFTANDFNDSTGNISIDYTNGQAAANTTKGFLAGADFTAFNVNRLSTTSVLTNGQLLVSGAGAAGNTTYSIATGTIAGSTGLSVTAGQSIIGSGLTITNTGVTSNVAGNGISLSGGTGAVTITNTIGYPFTLANVFGTANRNSTSTAILDTDGLFASSTVNFGNSGVAGQFHWDSALGFLGLGTSTPSFELSVTGQIINTATTTTAGLNVFAPTVGTSTVFIYSKTAGFGGQIILEDQGGTACTAIVTSAGTVSGKVVTCPTQF